MDDIASEGVDIQTGDGSDEWTDVDDVDWVDVWQSIGADSPGADYRREWLPERVDVWGASLLQIAGALRLHDETPTWGYSHATRIIKAAIADGQIHHDEQGVLCPAEVLDDE